MSNNFKDILSNLNKDIEQEKLLEYLNNQLPSDEQHEVESSLNDDAFMNDAMDGLQQFENKQEIPSIVQKLNADLNKQLSVRKKRRRIKDIPGQPWAYYAVILILLLCIITYVVIKRMN